METLYSVHQLEEDGVWKLIHRGCPKARAIEEAVKAAGEHYWVYGVLVMEKPVGRMLDPVEIAAFFNNPEPFSRNRW